MKVPPIKSTRNYECALYRIDQLMETKSDTKTGDELHTLTTLVEPYEAKHYSFCPPIPWCN